MRAKELWELWEKIELHSTKVKLSSIPETREVISNFKSIRDAGASRPRDGSSSRRR
jgi:hypothetical protein